MNKNMTVAEFAKLSFTDRARMAKSFPREYRILRKGVEAKRAELSVIARSAAKLDDRDQARAQLAQLQPPELDGPSAA